MVVILPLSVSIAGERDVMSRSPASTASVDIVAKFMSAAMVEFKHERFMLPDENSINQIDQFQDALVVQSFNDTIQKASVTVHGESGETAQVNCELQQMDFSSIETFKPIRAEQCSQVVEYSAILSGNQTDSDVEIGKLGSNLGDSLQNYVSLEISYI